MGNIYTGGIRVVETVGRLDGFAEGIFDCHERPGAAGEAFGSFGVGACGKFCCIGADETCRKGFQTGSDGLGSLDKTFGASCGIGASGTFGRNLGACVMSFAGFGP